MRTTEKLTITVSRPVADALRSHARHSGASVSAVTDRALRDFLLGQAMAAHSHVSDDEWLQAVAETIENPAR